VGSIKQIVKYGKLTGREVISRDFIEELEVPRLNCNRDEKSVACPIFLILRSEDSGFEILWRVGSVWDVKRVIC